MPTQEEAKKMLDDLVNKCTEMADSQLKGLPKQIDKLMLTDRQIAKKIISIKSPKISDEDLNLIVYGKDLKKELGASYKKFVSENEKLNPNIVVKDVKSQFKALEDDNPIFDEVKKLKTEVKDGAYILEQKAQDLGKEVAKLGVMLGSTIPAAAILVAPTSFNVPGALTLTLNLINAIGAVNFKVKEFTPALRFVDKLKYVIPDEKLDQIVNPLNTIVGSVNNVMNATSKLQLPNFSEAKEKAAVAFQKEMEGYEAKLKSLNVNMFANATNPQLAFEAEKTRLTSLKESVSAKVEKLLK
jgi:hypothetical protein